MRLSKIKLAGFKTFVDPTTVTFPSNLVGVVGPNGCGKSNIIDAVRWVMGESSAKNLRGDELTDVIFNGSSSRKPVGSATIELIFDNSDGKIGGQYASYNEVSIKRVMNRDGQSTYFLNNTRCRRKDITHVFLGTGLGARSYSIIEQGMISRFVEAKPDDMRSFLEEAAGISKYKERRRETHNRIRHTRDNLDRLNDLRDEVEKQLKHLQRQASVAEKYKTYKEESRRLDAELLALRYTEMEDRRTAEAKLTHEKEMALEAAIGRMRSVEAEIEKLRSNNSEHGDAFNSVQENFYKVGTEIARLEQLIQHARELKQRQQQDIEDSEQGIEEFEAEITRDETRLTDLSAALADMEPEWARLTAVLRESEAEWQVAETKMNAWQAQWQTVSKETGDATQAAQVERTRIEHLDQQLQSLLVRQERLEVERSALSPEELAGELNQLTASEADLKLDLHENQRQLQHVNEQIQQMREQDAGLTVKLDEQRAGLQQRKGRLSSLEALQQAALGGGQSDVYQWLEGAGLASNPRVAQQLQVAPGWELAVETVLGDYLEAVCVDGLDSVAAVLGDIGEVSVSFMDQRETAVPAPRTLAAKVSGSAGVTGLLANVRIADSLSDALNMRNELSEHESVVTPDGIWLNASWLRVNREKDAEAGVIARETELRELRAECQAVAAQVAELDEQHQSARTTLKELEQQRDDRQSLVNRVHREHVDLIARMDARQSRLSDMHERLRMLDADHEDLSTAISETDEKIKVAQQALDFAERTRVDAQERLNRLKAQEPRVKTALDEARTAFERDRAAAHSIEVKVESQRSTRESAQENLGRLRDQLSKLSDRRTELLKQLSTGEAPLAAHQEQLTGLLEDRLVVEKELGDARKVLEATEHQLREREQQRQACEKEVAEQRETVQQGRISAQEIKVRRDTIAERFAETGFEMESVKEGLPEQADPQEWQEKVELMQRRISRLGNINLAAIDEYKEQLERKEYLDSQHADLIEALEILESAIRKIDRETRTRFRETFDQVNAGFKQLFPKLFGGGHAYLELNDTDLLTAGVTVMAQPPGKRNSTIHLLSGGEKALTAVALVFSIFQLNAAPFCMLDEVDAPLDDANVNRFCNILKEMSDRIQFIIITHNKSTIALADQLIGVTMQEAGVSRPVAVDIGEAVEMAEAS
ncbi:MAG: chromosome segregation protein SMC [Gammaproteobacteria bacterium]|nr:chromosome segregation protein SMC [Gammaproteobacteria bacterium]